MPWCLLAAAIAFLLAGPALAQRSPAVRTRVEVTAGTVRVCDVLTHPLPAVLQKHADASILKAPLPGREHTIPGPFLARKLALLAGVKNLGIEVPNRVTVFRKGQDLKETQMLPILKKEAERTWKAPVSLTNLRVVGRRTVPLGKLSLTPEKKRLRIRRDRIELPVSVSVDGESLGRLTLTADVSLIKKVVVTTAAVRQGEELTPAHLALAPHPVSPSDLDVITDPDHALGYMTTRPIRSGTVLTSPMVKVPPLVERGEGVRIKYILGGLVITATGIASETGGMGEFIKVKNTRSGKHITCRVIGERRVEPLL